MGSAILSGVLRSCAKTLANGDTPRISRFIATVQSQGSVDALETRFPKEVEVSRGANVKAMQEADIVLLACKPYLADKILGEAGIFDAITGKLVISVLVGSPIAKLKRIVLGQKDMIEQLKKQSKVQEILDAKMKTLYFHRAMCNCGAEFGESMTVIETNPEIPAKLAQNTDWIFEQLGKIAPVVPELYDIGGVLAGTTPSFLSIAFDGMLDGAVSEGMKRADAKRILTQSLIAMARLLENGEHPAMIREKAASPKGTTIAGILALEENGVRHAFTEAVIASSERSKDIGK
jgi:pyrroline-5-carboxylate reductase